MKIIKKLDNAYWACYRWVRDRVSPVWYRFFGHKFHIVKTKLTPCSWIDTDQRMLYAVMDLVEWFVDNDMNHWSKEDVEAEYKRLKEEDPEDKLEQLKCFDDQHKGDCQIIEIASWWKNYPNRLRENQDAVRAWFAYLEKFRTSDDEPCWQLINKRTIMNEEERKEENRLSDLHNSLEEKLNQEEQEMLKLAVELRNRMWS